MIRCPGCGATSCHGSQFYSEILCKNCREAEARKHWIFSDVYPVTITQKGMLGRRRKEDQTVPLFFEPEIPFLPQGNRNNINVDIGDFENELGYIGKGSKVKMSFYRDEFGSLKIRNLGV